MNNELKSILSRVDHTLLAQSATWNEIKAICDDGIRIQLRNPLPHSQCNHTVSGGGNVVLQLMIFQRGVGEKDLQWNGVSLIIFGINEDVRCHQYIPHRASGEYRQGAQLAVLLAHPDNKPSFYL